jgi:hypothetical protein
MKLHMRSAAVALTACSCLLLTACKETVAPPRPEVLKANSAVQQSGVVGEPVTAEPSVLVTNFGGRPVGGVDVTFAIVEGSGTLANSTVKSDGSGVATLTGWTLGTVAGPNRVTVSASGINASVTFTVDAAPAVANRVTVGAVQNPDAQSGAVLAAQVVELRDRFNNIATNDNSTLVTASLVITSGIGQLAGTTSTLAAAGKATFGNLSITGSGTFQLRFSASGLPPVLTPPFQVVPGAECGTGTVHLQLDFALGQTSRYLMSEAAAPECLFFQQARNAGQQYLLLFENMPLSGGYSAGVFPGLQADSTFPLRVQIGRESSRDRVKL